MSYKIIDPRFVGGLAEWAGVTTGWRNGREQRQKEYEQGFVWYNCITDEFIVDSNSKTLKKSKAYYRDLNFFIYFGRL